MARFRAYGVLCGTVCFIFILLVFGKGQLRFEVQSRNLKCDDISSTMHTYFEDIGQWSESGRAERRMQLSVWKKNWEAQGWKTKVLNKSFIDATVFDVDSEMKGINLGIAREYDMHCYLRYFAMASTCGGWMSDLDTIPLKRMTPGDKIPHGGVFTGYDKYIPSLISANKSEWARIGLLITKQGRENGHKGDLFSDMMALQSLPAESFQHEQMVLGISDANSVDLLFQDKYSFSLCERLFTYYAAHISTKSVRLYGNHILKGLAKSEIISRIAATYLSSCS